jgi:hypothetical protein
MKTKRCLTCEEIKVTSEFTKDASRRDGLKEHCKICRNAVRRARRQAEPERIRDRERAWREKTGDRKAITEREWEKRNPDLVAAQKKRYRQRHGEEIAKYKKEWGRRNRHLTVASVKRHAARYPEKAQARNAVREAIRYGRLVKPDHCEDCDAYVLDPIDLHAHHEDYSKPLDVRWLCRPCHVGVHHPESRKPVAA